MKLENGSVGGLSPADVAQVDRRLRARLTLGPLTGIERAQGGQSNPTLFLDYGTVRLVLRTQPAGEHAGGAHDLRREYRFLTALAGTQVPVPEPVLFGEDERSRQHYVMQRVEGDVPDDARLPDMTPPLRGSVYRAHAQTLAALHSIDVDEVGLSDLHRPGGFLARQQRRWLASFGTHRQPDVALLGKWMSEHQAVSRDEHSIVHGDMKLNNVVVSRTGLVIGVLDWELATVGDPMLDLAHVWCATWATRPHEYGGLPESAAERRGLGLPEFGEYESWYWQARGLPSLELTPYYRALALLRYAGIFHGIGVRASAGTAASDTAARDSALADVFLDRALATAGLPSTKDPR